jgi:hypothetical protein
MILKNWLIQFKNRKNKPNNLYLIDRYYLGEVPRKGVWFYYGKWSVLDIGKLMKTAPFKWGGFTGFEAMMDNDSNETITYREDDLEKLLQKINN